MSIVLPASRNGLRQAISLVGAPLVVMWLILWLDLIVARPLGEPLIQFGIQPRTLGGLRGIVLAPFLHANTAHLLSNSLPWLIMGSLILMRSTRLYLLVVAGGLLFGGLGTWLIGAPATHVGASGLTFCFFGFLLWRGWFERSFVSIVIAALVGFIYGGVIWGVLPAQPGISWESHLAGFAAGMALARFIPRGA